MLLAWQISMNGLQRVLIDIFYALTVSHGLFFGRALGVRNAIFMGTTNPAVAAMQFTAYMGMCAVAISLGNYWQGHVAERMGYATVLYLDAMIAMLVILLVPFLRGRDPRKPRPARNNAELQTVAV